MTTILNTVKHTNTGLMVEPFGTDGAAHFVVLKGEQSATPFILDAAAVIELSDTLFAIARDGGSSDKGVTHG